MENKNYEWLMKSLAKSVDANSVVEEFKKIEDIYGTLTPDSIVNFASNPQSVLHSLFEWDDTEAAKMYRLQQARTIINNIQVVVISSGNSMRINAYEIIKSDNKRFYKNVEEMSKPEINQVINQTIESINELRNKLKIFKELNKVDSKLEEAINELYKYKE